LITEDELTTAKPFKLPMDPHLKLLSTQGSPLEDDDKCRRLVGKLIYVTITKPDSN